MDDKDIEYATKTFLELGLLTDEKTVIVDPEKFMRCPWCPYENETGTLDEIALHVHLMHKDINMDKLIAEELGRIRAEQDADFN